MTGKNTGGGGGTEVKTIARERRVPASKVREGHDEGQSRRLEENLFSKTLKQKGRGQGQSPTVPGGKIKTR